MTTGLLARTQAADAQAAWPLAPEQSGLWYLQQLAPACGAYHLLFSVDIEITDPAWTSQLPSVLDELLADYPILRTALPASAEGPVQQMHAEIAPDIRVVDAQGWPDDALRERARVDSRAPFDLSRPPLWRIQLYRRAASRWLAVVVAHHVLLDFWSLGLLLQDVAGRLGLAKPPTQRPDGSGYGRYAERAQARLQDPERTRRWLQYWHVQLHDAPAVHSLPLDAPRLVQQDHEGRSVRFAFDAAGTEAIRQAARAHDATPFMVLLAAYCVLLHRYSGEGDMVVASPVAGRTERAQRLMLGHFVNTVALRVRVDDEMDFASLVARVKDVVVGALREQSCPFPWLVENLAPRRDPSHAPLAQIGFSWERLPLLAELEPYFLADPPALETRLAGVCLRPFAVPQQEGQHELMLEMGGERDGGYLGVFKYQPRLFREATIATMAECFVRLAPLLAADADKPVGTVRLDDARSAAAWLAPGFGPDRQWPPGTVLGDIAAQAALRSAAPAVRDARGAIDRGELRQRSERIAAALQAMGVEPGSRVGLMLDRSVDLVAGILGVWLAGAAYVPLDPGFPRDRLAHIANDAQLRALISERSQQALWPDGVPPLCLDEDLPPAAGAALHAVQACAETAYILYTSGSTGMPKGVRVGHASLRNFLLAMQELLNWDESTRLLAVTTPAFDISALELLLPLLVGGEVLVADSVAIRDGAALSRWLADQSVNAMQATPASWKMLVDAGWPGNRALTALCGGEPLPPRLAEQLHARVGTLWNVYGPTETTVWSTAARLAPGSPIHLGQAIANTRLYVLDAQDRPVPPGMLGELWIGGDGLALDYWARPELTAERFRPLATLPEAGRLYRTGDRVRWTSDGRLEHHGRLDFQVKVRGFRIELGEIESALRIEPGVKDVVVVVREDQPGDPRLVAYVVPDAEAAGPLSVDTLRQSLRRSLPAYMLPSAFVVLDALPQTPNRKIDRKALPAPRLDADDACLVAPRDALEIQLAGMFGELLGLDAVGINQSFFDLGGHSLLAVRLVADIKRVIGIELAVAELVQHASVAALATRLRDVGGAEPGMRLVLRAGKDVQPLWFFHPIGGTVFCYLELVRHLSARRPVLAIQSPGLQAAGEAEVTIEAMARRYVAVLRESQPNGPYLLGGWCFGGTIAFEAARQLRDAGEQVDGVFLVDTRAPVPANVPSDGDDAMLMSWFARDLAAPYGKALHIEPAVLRALPTEAMFGQVLDAAKAIDVLPQDADVDRLARYFEAYIANGIALQSYFPTPEDLPVLLLRAVDEAEDYGPALGWDQLAPGTLDIVDLAGTHNSIMYAPQARDVAAQIDHHHPLQPLEGFTT